MDQTLQQIGEWWKEVPFPIFYRERKVCHLLPLPISPHTSEMRKMMIKIQKRTFAMDIAPAAMPPNPKIAAMIAMIKNINAQYSILLSHFF